MSAARASARLPGFKFETQAPPLDEVLPRMDIAVFVGFAASGPLDRPVAIESDAQFQGVFGRDAPLAWDVERCEQVYAYLGPAVRSFFANGGLRCWVIRVARRQRRSDTDRNQARYNYFPVPGLIRAAFDPQQAGKVRGLSPAFARARSEGSWSDSLRVGAALLSRSMSVTGVTFPKKETDAYVVRLAQSSMDLAPGDLLRLTFKQDQYVLFLSVESTGPGVSSPPGRTTTVSARRAVWFQPVSASSLPPPGKPVKTAVFTRERKPDPVDPVTGFERQYDAVLNPQPANFPSAGSPPASPPAVPKGQAVESAVVRLKLLNCSTANAPPPGSLVRIDLQNEEWWLMVASLSVSAGETQAVLVSGSAWRRIKPPQPLPVAQPACESLTFELCVRQAEEYSINLSDLGLAPGSERFWQLLPTDEELYADPNASLSGGQTTLWRQTGELLRFPLAGTGGASSTADELYLPLDMTAVPESFAGPVKLEGTELERDGLGTFDSGLFLDPALASTLTESLLTEADFLRYQAPRARALTGMHAAMALEEATIIAVPDAVHRGWSKVDPGQPPEPGGDSSRPRPEWWQFLDCRKRSATAPALRDCDPKPAAPALLERLVEPRWGNFLNCAIRVIAPPQLLVSEAVSSTGTFTLFWRSSPPIAGSYVLQEAANADFSEPREIYSGDSTSFTIYGRGAGDYFYRVSLGLDGNTSDWSNGVVVRVVSRSSSRMDAESNYQADVLLAVQRALLRLCTVRGDLFGALSLPEHYREDKAIEHAGLLKDATLVGAGPGLVPPLAAGEVNDFSYGALFHPWLVASEEGDQGETNTYRGTPPCGAAAGVMARRSLSRGAWIAPANEPLRGVVALQPRINRERYLELQDARINLLRQEPRGFIVLDADTLSDDPDLGLINVRRLLMLLRRQAVRLGMNYVFEPNSPAFRRLVERGFTDLLDQMFIRGAFAGDTPASSYQVVADSSLNTAQSVDQGRFIVELRVAPSLPMNFLTLRLVQNGDRSFVTEGR